MFLSKDITLKKEHLFEDQTNHFKIGDQYLQKLFLLILEIQCP
jgi:hypothetical protein